MRIGAQWIYSEQGWDDSPTRSRARVARHRLHRRGNWAELLLLISLISGGIGVRRLKSVRRPGLLKATLICR